MPMASMTSAVRARRRDGLAERVLGIDQNGRAQRNGSGHGSASSEQDGEGWRQAAEASSRSSDQPIFPGDPRDRKRAQNEAEDGSEAETDQAWRPRESAELLAPGLIKAKFLDPVVQGPARPGGKCCVRFALPPLDGFRRERVARLQGKRKGKNASPPVLGGRGAEGGRRPSQGPRPPLLARQTSSAVVVPC